MHVFSRRHATVGNCVCVIRHAMSSTGSGHAGDQCSLFDLAASDSTVQLLRSACRRAAVEGSGNNAAARDLFPLLTNPSPRLCAVVADSFNPRDLYCKAATFSSDDSMLVSPYFRGVRLMPLSRVLAHGRDARHAAEERQAHTDEPWDSAPPAAAVATTAANQRLAPLKARRLRVITPLEMTSGALATALKKTCLVARMQVDEGGVVACGGLCQTVAFFSPQL
jgi:hypothetical protein